MEAINCSPEQPVFLAKKSVLRDSSISWKAKGIYFYLTTLNGSLNFQKLCEISKDDIKSLHNAFDELISEGYLTSEEKGDRNEWSIIK